jgi:hypothetical protein
MSLLTRRGNVSRELVTRAILRRRRLEPRWSSSLASVSSSFPSSYLTAAKEKDASRKDTRNQLLVYAPRRRLHTLSSPLGSRSLDVTNYPLHHDYQVFFYSDESQRPVRTIGTTRVPTPPSAPEDESTLESLKKTIASPQPLLRKTADGTISIFQAGLGFIVKLPGHTWFYIQHPDEFRQKLANGKKIVQDEIHHYWVGFKVSRVRK